MAYQLNQIEKEVVIEQNRTRLHAVLALPDSARTIIVFAHGSGSGRYSARNNFVARVLQKHNHATLLMDLLDEREAEDAGKVFDIELLAKRLVLAKSWLEQNPLTAHLKIGLFGASTGAAAALLAAVKSPENIFALVSRGGRPDLADPYLKKVHAPTLLIVGGGDETVLDLNRRALEKLPPPKELKVVPDATHLFAEKGALEEVARLATEWFDFYSKDLNRRTASA